MQPKEKLQWVPDKPGVYLMRSTDNDVIYVGKASSLRKRLQSYFRSSVSQGAKVQSLVRNINDFEYIVTDTEVEALILEYNLIKKYKPKYNVMFRDDKSYPYLKMTLNENWPQIIVTRNMRDDGARYFGPYTSAGALHETVRLIRRLFPIRTCKQSQFNNRSRPCLNFHINRCLAPCTGCVNRETYMQVINEVILFMEGKQEDLIKRLEKKMQAAAESREFEKAARYRDQIASVKSVLEKQKIVSSNREDYDVIGMTKGSNEACVQIFFVRKGRLTGRDHFFLEDTDEMTREEVMGVFLKEYYSRASEIVPRILLSDEASDSEVIASWLSEKKGRRVVLHVPKRGEKFKLVEMVSKNALLELEEYEKDRSKKEKTTEEALLEVKEYLKLDNLPLRIECYDISNISGTSTVGSMVVFENGAPKTSDYRRFKINTVSGPDDYSSLKEMLTRRFSKINSSRSDNKGEGNGDKGFLKIPDLVIIDGGKGQLSAAKEEMDKLGINDIPVYGLAKKDEELFGIDSSEPLRLPKNSQALFLLQRIRDEAHRFAVTYHRALRSNRSKKSALDEIPGVGPKRKRALLRIFGSLDKIKEASVKELAEIKGMNSRVAERIKEHLKK